MGLAAVRLRPQPGLVRICEPARRAGRHGGRRAAGLQLGLRRGPRDPHGGAHHRPQRGAGRRARSTPSACRSSAATASRAEMASAHRGGAPSATIPPPAGSTLPTSAAKLSTRTAAVYVESPSYLGVIEAEGAEIARLAHRALAPRRSSAPTRSRSACSRRRPTTAPTSSSGPTQPLGVHMNCGGGVGGFIASRDEERYVARVQRHFWSQSPGRASPASSASACASSHQTSYGMRETARTGPETRSTCGRSRTPSTWRCSGRRGFARSAS